MLFQHFRVYLDSYSYNMHDMMSKTGAMHNYTACITHDLIIHVDA